MATRQLAQPAAPGSATDMAPASQVGLQFPNLAILQQSGSALRCIFAKSKDKSSLSLYAPLETSFSLLK